MAINSEEYITASNIKEYSMASLNGILKHTIKNKNVIKKNEIRFTLLF